MKIDHWIKGDPKKNEIFFHEHLQNDVFAFSKNKELFQRYKFNVVNY